jgi:hypothetical protein
VWYWCGRAAGGTILKVLFLEKRSARGTIFQKDQRGHFKKNIPLRSRILLRISSAHEDITHLVYVTRFLSTLMCVTGLSLVICLLSGLLLLSCHLKDSSASSSQFLLLPLASYGAAIVALPHPSLAEAPSSALAQQQCSAPPVTCHGGSDCSLVDRGSSFALICTLPPPCHSPPLCHQCCSSVFFLLVLLMSPGVL